MEGNLRLADCSMSAEVIKYSFKEFESDKYEEIKANLAHSNESHAKLRYSWMSKTTAGAFYKTCESIVQWSRNEKLLDIYTRSPMPKLYIYGSKNIEKVQGLINTELAGISNAGHFMILDNSKETYEKVAKFLQEEH